MKWFKALLTGSIALLALLAGVIFVMRNHQGVAIDFILLGSMELSAGAWVLASFTLGLCVAWLLVLPGFMLGRWRITRQRRKISRQDIALAHSQSLGDAQGK